MTEPSIPPVRQLLDDMTAALQPALAKQPLMIGVQTGGMWVAEKLHAALDLPDELGGLDITFYRDDFSRKGLNPKVAASHLPEDVEDRHIILVDDVLQSGRTIRAAINEIFDYGRPASVTLAVLVARDGRELPIQADVAGMTLDLQKNQHIRLSGPDELSLSIEEAQL